MSSVTNIARVDFAPAAVAARAGLPADGEPRKKILVVGDDSAGIAEVSLALHSKGYETITASDGAEVISSIQNENPDVLLVQVCLPLDVDGGGIGPWDGFQVIQWGLHVNTRRIPAIVMSGSERAEYRHWAATAGAVGFMSKPLDAAFLLGAVESMLEHALPQGGVKSLKMAV